MTKFQKVNNCFYEKKIGGEYNLRGWVHRLRKHKDTIFLSLRDSTGIIQCLVPFEPKYDKITIESSIEISGKLVEDIRSPGGAEIHATEMNIVGIAENYPIRKDFSTEFLLDVRHLWNRSRKMTAIMKVRAQILIAAREWFDKNEWHETTPPIINRSACEGGSTLFEVGYFGDKAYLSQSAQLYLESLIFSLEDVWSLTPSFRAEKSKTPRHLAEYWHLEGEQAWATFNDILSIEERLITHIAHQVAERSYEELEFLKQNPNDLKDIKLPFERIPYAEVIKFLKSNGKDINLGDDLGTDDERLLTQNSIQPVFVSGYPRAIKPFYTKIDPSDETMVLSADMLAPKGLGEISTGGQREEDLNTIINRIKSEGFNPEDYSWYLDLRKYGSVPHSGFGFGVERLVRWMCNLDHIRDAIPYPRTMIRSYP